MLNVDNAKVYHIKEEELIQAPSTHTSIDQTIEVWNLKSLTNMEIIQDHEKDKLGKEINKIRKTQEKNNFIGAGLLFGGAIGGIFDLTLEKGALSDSILLGGLAGGILFGGFASVIFDTSSNDKVKEKVLLVFKDGNKLLLEVDEQEFYKIKHVLDKNIEDGRFEEQSLFMRPCKDISAKNDPLKRKLEESKMTKKEMHDRLLKNYISIMPWAIIVSCLLPFLLDYFDIGTWHQLVRGEEHMASTRSLSILSVTLEKIIFSAKVFTIFMLLFFLYVYFYYKRAENKLSLKK